MPGRTEPTSSKYEVAHGVTSTGRQRALDIEAEIARIESEHAARGESVFVVFGGAGVLNVYIKPAGAA